MKNNYLKEIEKILRETFPLARIDKINKEMKMGDFSEWDSLGNFNLLLAIEDYYKVRFSIEEMSNIRTIAKIIKVLKNKND